MPSSSAPSLEASDGAPSAATPVPWQMADVGEEAAELQGHVEAALNLYKLSVIQTFGGPAQYLQVKLKDTTALQDFRDFLWHTWPLQAQWTYCLELPLPAIRCPWRNVPDSGACSSVGLQQPGFLQAATHGLRFHAPGRARPARWLPDGAGAVASQISRHRCAPSAVAASQWDATTSLLPRVCQGHVAWSDGPSPLAHALGVRQRGRAAEELACLHCELPMHLRTARPAGTQSGGSYWAARPPGTQYVRVLRLRFRALLVLHVHAACAQLSTHALGVPRQLGEVLR